MEKDDFVPALEKASTYMAEFARMFDISQHTIKSWKAGRSPIPPWARKVLAVAKDDPTLLKRLADA